MGGTVKVSRALLVIELGGSPDASSRWWCGSGLIAADIGASGVGDSIIDMVHVMIRGVGGRVVDLSVGGASHGGTFAMGRVYIRVGIVVSCAVRANCAVPILGRDRCGTVAV